jgi:hypothetical protein
MFIPRASLKVTTGAFMYITASVYSLQFVRLLARLPPSHVLSANTIINIAFGTTFMPVSTPFKIYKDIRYQQRWPHIIHDWRFRSRIGKNSTNMQTRLIIQLHTIIGVSFRVLRRSVSAKVRPSDRTELAHKCPVWELDRFSPSSSDGESIYECHHLRTAIQGSTQ